MCTWNVVSQLYFNKMYILLKNEHDNIIIDEKGTEKNWIVLVWIVPKCYILGEKM